MYHRITTISLLLLLACQPQTIAPDALDSLTGQAVVSPAGTVSEGEESNVVLVQRIIDGDTIELANEERVRLICINTPERGEPGYQEATDRLETLILGREVRLEKDMSERDRYGRLLRYVFLGPEDIQHTMVKEGYAKAYPYPPDVKYCYRYEAAEQGAVERARVFSKALDEAVEEAQVLETPVEEIEPEAGRETSQEPAVTVECGWNAYNCADFATHAQAQNTYVLCGGPTHDIHRLDGDNDGLACESLP